MYDYLFLVIVYAMLSAGFCYNLQEINAATNIKRKTNKPKPKPTIYSLY
jgi:hypothetical protein